MFGDESSAFWFYGRFSPAIEVPPFFAQEVPVAEKARIEIIFEHLGIWAGPGTRECKQPGEVSQLARLILGSWGLIAGQGLEWSLDGWVEAKKACLEGSIMGHRPPHFRDPEAADENSTLSKQMREAAELAVHLRSKVKYRLALRNIHIALQDDTDDAVFFSYRGVETAARAITQIEDNLDRQGWSQFHRLLGRSPADGKELMQPLIDARKAIAHGQMSAPLSPEKRADLILLARRLVGEALEADALVPVGTVPVFSHWRNSLLPS